MKRLAKILLDSRRPAMRPGPNAAMAVSGPTTARSTPAARARATSAFPSVAEIGQFSPRVAVPAFPGAAKISLQDGACASRHERASSRAPLPITRIFTTHAARGSFPFHRCGGLRGDVVRDAVDAAHLVDDARANPLEQIVRQARPVGRHAVLARYRAHGDEIGVGASIAHHADTLQGREDR